MANTRIGAREQQHLEIDGMLEDLRLAQSPDERRLKRASRALEQVHTRIFEYSERYRTLRDHLMHWREQLAMVAPHLVAACFSNCRAAVGHSADMSPANGQAATCAAAPPMLLVDDHLGGKVRRVARRRTHLVNVAHLGACRDLEAALNQLVEELRVAGEDLALLREAIFDVNYTAVGVLPHILKQNVKRSRERHTQSCALVDELRDTVETLIEGNAIWLSNLVADLATELGADVFYDV